MLKRELKVNLKSFIIWTLILVGLFLLIFLLYPSIVTSDNVKALNEMMKVFPEDVLKAFNMDITTIDSAFGWLKSEGFVFLLLITSSYAGILGSNILLKEENDKTIEYLNSVPVCRKSIVLNKFISGIIYIILMIIIIGVFNFIGLKCSGSFDTKLYLLLSITPIFPAITIYCLCMFLSTFTHKTKNMLGISLGIVFISYILNTVASLSESVEYIKYLSVFTLADIRNVILDCSINPIMLIITLIFVIVLFILIIIRYDHKELIG